MMMLATRRDGRETEEQLKAELDKPSFFILSWVVLLRLQEKLAVTNVLYVGWLYEKRRRFFNCSRRKINVFD